MLTDELRVKMKELFTLEERETINKLINEGNHEMIAHAIIIQNQAQEKWLQDYLNNKCPRFEAGGSSVRKEMDALEAKGGLDLTTPEKEAYWQDKLDEEAKMLKQREKNYNEFLKNRENKEDITEDVETETAKVDTPREEMIAFLVEKGIKCRKTLGDEKLLERYNAALKEV